MLALAKAEPTAEESWAKDTSLYFFRPIKNQLDSKYAQKYQTKKLKLDEGLIKEARALTWSSKMF